MWGYDILSYIKTFKILFHSYFVYIYFNYLFILIVAKILYKVWINILPCSKVFKNMSCMRIQCHNLYQETPKSCKVYFIEILSLSVHQDGLKIIKLVIYYSYGYKKYVQGIKCRVTIVKTSIKILKFFKTPFLTFFTFFILMVSFLENISTALPYSQGFIKYYFHTFIFEIKAVLSYLQICILGYKFSFVNLPPFSA